MKNTTRKHCRAAGRRIITDEQIWRDTPEGRAMTIAINLHSGISPEGLARVRPYLAPLIPAVERLVRRFELTGMPASTEEMAKAGSYPDVEASNAK